VPEGWFQGYSTGQRHILRARGMVSRIFYGSEAYSTSQRDRFKDILLVRGIYHGPEGWFQGYSTVRRYILRVIGMGFKDNPQVIWTFHRSKGYSTYRQIFHGSGGYSTGQMDISQVQGIFHGSGGCLTGPRDNSQVRGIFHGSKG